MDYHQKKNYKNMLKKISKMPKIREKKTQNKFKRLLRSNNTLER